MHGINQQCFFNVSTLKIKGNSFPILPYTSTNTETKYRSKTLSWTKQVLLYHIMSAFHNEDNFLKNNVTQI